jgi:hypothetical protein
MKVRKLSLSLIAENLSSLLSKNVRKGTDLQNYNSVACLYECETRSLTLREEHTSRLRVVENAVLRKLFGPKRNEVTGGFIIFIPYTILFGNQEE